jgi:hypothetical protein
MAPKVSTPATKEIAGRMAVLLLGAALRVEVVLPDAEAAVEVEILGEMDRVATGAVNPLAPVTTS